MTFWAELVRHIRLTGTFGTAMAIASAIGLAGGVAAPLLKLLAKRPSVRYAGAIACFTLAACMATAGTLESRFERLEAEECPGPGALHDCDLEWGRQHKLAFYLGPVTEPAWLGWVCALPPVLFGLLALLLPNLTRPAASATRSSRTEVWIARSLLPVAALSIAAARRASRWDDRPHWDARPWNLLIATERFDKTNDDEARARTCMTASNTATAASGYGLRVATRDPGFEWERQRPGFDDALRALVSRCTDWTLAKLAATEPGHAPDEALQRALGFYRPFLDTEHRARVETELRRLFPPSPPSPPSPIDYTLRVDGAHSQKEITAGLRSLLPAFRTCAKEYGGLPLSAASRHRFLLTFNVTPRGRTSPVSTKNDSAPNYLRRCVHGAMYEDELPQTLAGRFPAKPDGTRVAFPITIELGPGYLIRISGL
jgi:hypothetical protein